MTGAMSPELGVRDHAAAAQRWRAVDAAVQAALSCELARRDAVVADACGTDDAMRGEVQSLLAAHDRAGGDFLERPAAASLAAALASTLSPPTASHAPRRRTVSARAALYVAGVMLALGLVGGWQLAGSAESMSRLTSAASEFIKLPVQISAQPDWQPAGEGALSLDVVGRDGRAERGIAANRPWTPRFSPDGRRVAYGAFGQGRNSSDLWVTDLDAGTARRVTDDIDDSNDPQWSPDGRVLAYSAQADGGKDVLTQPASGGQPTIITARDGTQFPSDWLRDGSALLVTDAAGQRGHDIIVQPTDGSAPWPYAATSANETAARASPDGRWVAYTSDESGRAEVYIDSYPRAGRRVTVSQGGGVHPVWRGDGRELYYWSEGALVAARVNTSGDVPAIEGRAMLFRAPYHMGLNTMYDVSPDGTKFVIVSDR